MNKYLSLSVMIVLLGIGIYLLGISLDPQEETPPPSDPATELPAEYRSERYAFSFEIPEGKMTHEYTPEIIAVGTPSENGFDADAEVVLVVGDDESEYEDLTDFLFKSTQNMCAADGPSGSISCEEIIDQQQFVNAQRLSGTVFYQRRVYTDFTTVNSTTDRLGPFYAFDVAENVPGHRYAVLFVRPAVILKETEIDAVLLRSVADSLMFLER